MRLLCTGPCCAFGYCYQYVQNSWEPKRFTVDSPMLLYDLLTVSLLIVKQGCNPSRTQTGRWQGLTATAQLCYGHRACNDEHAKIVRMAEKAGCAALKFRRLTCRHQHLLCQVTCSSTAARKARTFWWVPVCCSCKMLCRATIGGMVYSGEGHALLGDTVSTEDPEELRRKERYT